MINWQIIDWARQTSKKRRINTLRPRQNRRHFADDIFKSIFLNENARISLKISLKFVAMVRINNIPALVQIMAWRRPGDKPLSEPMMVRLLTHICVTRPQWVLTKRTKKVHWPWKVILGYRSENLQDTKVNSQVNILITSWEHPLDWFATKMRIKILICRYFLRRMHNFIEKSVLLWPKRALVTTVGRKRSPLTEFASSKKSNSIVNKIASSKRKLGCALAMRLL